MKPWIVSLSETCTPGVPVKTSATRERLAEEALDLAGARDQQLVVGGELVHAENGDDVLQILVALQHFLHAARDRVVLLADDVGRERLRGGGEGIDRRIDAQLRDGTLEHDGRVEVREGVRRAPDRSRSSAGT